MQQAMIFSGMQLWHNDTWVTNQAVLVEQGKIAKIAPLESYDLAAANRHI